MSTPQLNVDYWASLYSVYTDYAEQYDEAMEHSRLEDRAEHLWGWKGLNRSISFDQITTVIDKLDWDDHLDKSPQTAIESVSSRLVEEKVLDTQRIVTPAFLLHLADSESEQYSAKFPIYDRRVWNAFVYLQRLREEDETLYTNASQSSKKYAKFCRQFREACHDTEPQEYERALFMFGGFIMDLSPNDSPTPIAKIDDVLEKQEDALREMTDSTGYALVDLNATR